MLTEQETISRLRHSFSKGPSRVKKLKWALAEVSIVIVFLVWGIMGLWFFAMAVS
jgi:hypothetical protein